MDDKHQATGLQIISAPRGDAGQNYTDIRATDAQNIESEALSYDPVAVGALVNGEVTLASAAEPQSFFRRLVARIDLVLLALLIMGAAALVISGMIKDRRTAVQLSVGGDFGTVQLPLNEFLKTEDGINIDLGSVVVNGPLRLNKDVVITPSVQPNAPSAGQLYYDGNTNQLAYYNGTAFVPLTAQQAVVQSIGGATGAITLGGGLSVVGNQLTVTAATGVSSLGGRTGAVTLGSGLTMVGNALQNSGVLNVLAGTDIAVTTDGNGNVTVSNIGAGTGTVTSSGGTSGTLPLFTTSQNIEDSIVTQGGGVITVTGNLNISGSATLGTALSVANGGTGTTSLTANGVIIGNGAAAVSSVAAGGAGLCLMSTVGAPSWSACPGGGGVTSLNGLTGAISVANASAAGSTVTINDATTAAKGIASFNSTNFSTASGAVNTIQDIATSASPTFTGLTLSANAIIQGGTVTVGTTSQAGGLVLHDGSSNTGTVQTAALGQNTVYTLPDPGGVSATVCLSTGNCLGGGGGGANTALSNLASVAINATLLPGSAGAINLGSGALPFGDAFLAGSSGTPGTNNFRITGASTGGTRVITLPDATGTVCLSTGNCLGGGGGGANTALSNLTTVAINTTLLPGAAGTINLGSGALPFGDLFVAGSSGTPGTNNFRITGASTSGTRVITLPDASGTVAVSASAPLALSAAGNLSCGSCLTSAVTSLNGLTGAISVANASGSGSTVTIDNASAVAKGIASFNSTNFSVASGAVNTIQDIATSASPTFTGLTLSGNLTIQGGTATAGTTSQQGSLVLHDGNGQTATISVGSALVASTALAVPTAVGVSDTFCLLTLANCVGTGGGVSGSGTNNRLAKFTSTGSTIGDSTISDDGSTVTTSIDLLVQGGDVTIGTTSQIASVLLHDGNGQTTTLQAGNSVGNLTFILPTTTGGTNQCLKQSGTGNQLFWDNCDGGAGGLSGVSSLNGLTGALSIANASGVGSTVTIDNASNVAKGIASFNSTNFSVASGAVNTIQDIATSSSPTFTNLTLSGDLAVNGGDITSTGSITLASASNNAINLQAAGNGDVVTTLDADTNFQLTATGINANINPVAIAATYTGDQTSNAVDITLTNNSGASTGTLYGLNVNNADNGGNTGVADAIARFINNQATETVPDGVLVQNQPGSGTLTNGIRVLQNTAGSTTTNGIQIQQAGGTLSNGIQFAGTMTNGIYFASATTTADIRKDTTGFTLDLNNASNSTLTVTNAGAGVASISVEAGGSYTGAGAVTLSSGGSSGLTLDSASGRVTVATGDFLNTGISGVTGAAAGDIWYDTSDSKYKINEGGTTKIICNKSDLGCGAGATTPLQTAYGDDVDGGNATISLTAADDGLVFTNPTSGGTDGSAFLLQLNQQHTTAAVSAVDIIQASNASNAVNLTANAIDSETALSVSATALTTGFALDVTTGSSVTSGGGLRLSGSGATAYSAGAGLLQVVNNGAFTGPLATFSSSGTTSGTLLNLALSNASQTTASALNVAQTSTTTGYTGNLVNISGTSTTGASNLLNISSANTTAGNALNVTANSITTGVGINVNSSGTGLTTGSLLKVSSATTGAVNTNGIVSLQATGNYTSTANNGVLNVLATSTTGGTITNIQGTSLTTGVALNIAANTGTAIQVTSGLTSLTGPTSGSGTTLTVGNSTSTGSIAVFKDNATTVASIADGGAATFQNATDTTNAFRVLRSGSGGEVLGADTTASVIRLLNNNPATLSSWTTNSNNLPGARYGHGTTSANGYVYVVGGFDNTDTSTNTTYYAPLNANGSIGTWASTTTLPAARADIQAVTANGYIYALGGKTTDPGSCLSNVYFAKLNPNGTVGTWGSTTSLPGAAGCAFGSFVVANGYIYDLAGEDNGGAGLTAVYYAKLNADGTIGSWSTTNGFDTIGANQDRKYGSAVVANGYVYSLGSDVDASASSQVAYAKLNTDGTVGTWATTSSLCDTRSIGAAVVLNGYIYYLGGQNSTLWDVCYGQLNSNGTVGAFTSTTHMIEERRQFGAVTANGYIYAIGGENGTHLATQEYASPARVSIGGALDLVGLSGENLPEGSSGGQLTAGDTMISGNLNVTGMTTLKDGLSLMGTLSIVSSSDATSAFAVLNASNVPQFSIDTSNSRVYIGNPTADSTGALLVLDTKNTSGDPTAVDGAMYYNSSSNTMRCAQGGIWVSCVGGLVAANTSVPGGNTVANTAAETNFASNWSMPANYCVQGRVLRITAHGTYSTTGTPTLEFKVKAGTTVLGATGAQNAGTGVTNREWRVSFQTTCNAAPGGSAATENQGLATVFSAATTAGMWEMSNTATVNVATNASQTIQLSAQWGTASTSNTITLRQILVEAMGP